MERLENAQSTAYIGDERGIGQGYLALIYSETSESESSKRLAKLR